MGEYKEEGVGGVRCEGGWYTVGDGERCSDAGVSSIAGVESEGQ
jgi:hypothetical protein